ncbi:amino acid adenylation domain-containing protein [Kiloniella sp. b19]|uniref:amino acid adenylation domain-containing protein n=1 Tax=Kiloniella sp. GXU_MW_B19 TaxID=3141326 RepID=UPI0031D526B1
MEQALNSLQKAYLVGRSTHLPLGGVAMQDFREYRGRLDCELFRQRLSALVEKHSSLRTCIDEVRLVQSIREDVVLNLEIVDLTQDSHEQALCRIEQTKEDYAHRLFDLSAGSPWKVTLWKLPEGSEQEDTVVVFVLFDALLLDGFSISQMMKELFSDGDIAVAGNRPEPVEFSAQTKASDSDEAYWREKLEAVTAAPKLPWTQSLETVRSSRYQRSTLCVSRERFRALGKLGARQGLFRNTVLMSLVLEVLSTWLSEGSLCVGVPVAPGNAEQLGNRSGFIAVDWNSAEGSFASRAQSLQQDIHSGLEHLSFSGIEINRLLMKDSSEGPALPVVLTNALNWPMLDQDSPVSFHSGLTQTPQTAMDIRLSLNADGDLLIDIDFAREALEAGVVDDILRTLDEVVTNLDQPEDLLSLNASDYVDLSHYRFNQTGEDYRPGDYLGSLADNLFCGVFEQSALICGGEKTSYSELGQKVASILAAFEQRELGRGDVVAICLPRSPEHIAVTLACALAGLIWVPVDAASPDDRLEYLLENCCPSLVVSTGRASGRTDCPIASPDELLSAPAPDDPRALLPDLQELSRSMDPAYYLYTSGTTGKPKCVVLNNRATDNVVGQTIENWQITEQDVFISVTPLHHDMSVFDVFGSLVAGASLVLPEPGSEKDAIRWNQLVAEHGVTIWCSVPAILEMLMACLRSETVRSLRLVAQGGDYIKPSVIQRLHKLCPKMRLISLGGPTETTIWSIWHEIMPEDMELVPYGRALPANGYYLLNEKGGHCPAGVRGRIHTVGANVALGYLEEGKLVQKDFVSVSGDKGQPVRAFRTGDLGCFRRDGTLLFAGRVNNYIKVRGVRVSLPDIENELLKSPEIKQVLVVDYGSVSGGDSVLGALCVCDDSDGVASAVLRDFARSCLPESHVPSRFLCVRELPLSANGKPDRKQAAQLLCEQPRQATPQEREDDAEAAVEDCLGSRQEQLLSICLKVTGKPLVGIVSPETNLVELGLLPTHFKSLCARLEQEMGITVKPVQLLKCRNLSELENLVLMQSAKAVA